MAFLPALCSGCSRVQLLPLKKATTGELTCAVCGGDLRVVPGCSYGESDRQAFNEMSDIVAEAKVTPPEALALAEQLTPAASSGAFGPVIDQFCQRMPGLVPVQQAVGRNTAAQRRVLLLLKSVLDALATARRVGSEPPGAEPLPVEANEQRR